MKYLNNAPITDSAEFPFKKGTLQFLQDSHKENLANLLRGIIGSSYNPSNIYVLWGVTNAGTVPVYNIAAGAIFYNGEIFDFDAVSFTASGSNVGVFSIVTTQYGVDADPVTFTDTVARNVHNIRKIQLAQGASGSGITDYSAAAFLNLKIPAQLALFAPIGTPYTDNVAQITGTYPNLGVYVPAPASNLNPIVRAGSKHIGDVATGDGTIIAITFAALADANYYVMGTLRSTGLSKNDATVVWAVIDSTISTTGFSIQLNEFTGIVQALEFDFICFHK